MLSDKEPSKLSSMGVRGRLLLAFLGISMFSLVAAVSGLYSLSQVGGALSKLTEHRVPGALSWLELSRRVESIVRAAPALLVVNTESKRLEVSNEISLQAEQLMPLLQRDSVHATDAEKAGAAEVATLVAELTDNLVSLDDLVKKRLFIDDHKQKLIRQLANANSVAQRTLTAGARVLGAQIADWTRIRQESDDDGLSSEESELASSIIELIPQQKAAALVDAVYNNLLEITDAESAERIDVLMFPLKQSLKELSKISKTLPKRAKARLERQVTILEGLTTGPSSLPQTRKDELAVVEQAEHLLAVNVQLSESLTSKVSVLVDGANADIVDANLQATEVQTLSRNFLIGVVVLSLVSSVLIVWLYVGRNLIARLTALSDSMLAIAGGNLRAPLPAPVGGDEISRMAEALVVFRDTAIEVEEKNLRDIEEARRRLVDAIENSSEGFAFYGPDDRLVLCNSKYRELLYPDADVKIEPGMKFETIIRTAAEDGYICAAEGRIDEWVAERVAAHCNPGEPMLQKRSDGRWILINERRTEGGGTVAVYADITDLKEREQQLTEKSAALEQLSNQLAKYLPPQVYDSIFQGTQEVKLASKRKKITVFFSDIADFTAITDSLEPEELTDLLNHYLTEMSKIAFVYGATIDKYVGDGITAFFGDPESRGVKEDAKACVDMAIAMQRRMQELASEWLSRGLERPFRIRIGINTGFCTVGNFGSEDRMDYTINGSEVNLAARLESHAEVGGILLAHETYSLVKDSVLAEEREPLTVKGFAKPIRNYAVVGLHDDLATEGRIIRRDQEGLTLLIDRENLTNQHKENVIRTLEDVLSHLKV